MQALNASQITKNISFAMVGIAAAIVMICKFNDCFN